MFFFWVRCGVVGVFILGVMNGDLGLYGDFGGFGIFCGVKGKGVFRFF